MKFKLFQQVALARSIPEKNLQRGEKKKGEKKKGRKRKRVGSLLFGPALRRLRSLTKCRRLQIAADVKEFLRARKKRVGSLLFGSALRRLKSLTKCRRLPIAAPVKEFLARKC